MHKVSAWDGPKLKRFREQYGWKQREMACYLLGSPEKDATVGAWESGRNTMPLGIKVKLDVAAQNPNVVAEAVIARSSVPQSEVTELQGWLKARLETIEEKLDSLLLWRGGQGVKLGQRGQQQKGPLGVVPPKR